MAQLVHQFDLTRLQAFIVVAEEGSITLAARRLGVAQPALSASIRRLEADLEQRLFDRLPRGVALTRTGARLLPEVYELFGKLEFIRSELEEHSKTPSGEISIGLPPSVATVCLQPILHAISERYPAVAVRMVESMSGYLGEWVEAGDLDIAVTFNTVDTETLISTSLFQEEVMIVGQTGHFTELPDPIPIQRLPELPLILTSKRHNLRNVLEHQVLALGRSLNIRYEIDASHELVRLVRSGAGYGVFALSTFIEEIEQGTVEFRRLEPSYTRMVCLTRHRKSQSDMLNGVVSELIMKVCHDLRGAELWP